MISKKEYNKRVLLRYFLYSIGVVLGICVLLWLFRVTNSESFLMMMENKSFDIRQKTISAAKKVNDDIVILTVDNASYEYLANKYGEWPMPRRVYADIAQFIEKQKPTSIVFDFLFVNSFKSAQSDDLRLIEEFKNNNKIFTSINFDNLNEYIRKAEDLPEKLKVNIKNDAGLDLKNDKVSFTNCRMILRGIIDATSKIGHINLIREDDGIARKINPFAFYKNEFYPHLALKVGIDYLNKNQKIDDKNFYIDKNKMLILGDRKIPLDNNGFAILNWYGASGEYNPASFTYIPLWKLEKLAYGEEVDDSDKILAKDFFKNKIVYMGVSATSMYDIKSTPTEKNMPGVELHTTFINNLIDNNFIQRVPPFVDILITMVIGLIIGYIVLSFNSTVAASITSIMVSTLYMLFTTWLMREYNLWVSIVLPVSVALFVFISVYLVKYFRKSKDFEHTYKLATTDGLTELYNHRYFQEQMILNIETAKRYDSNFSLILIDIDFFKKFNDKFGHQSGDAVLKQVAQTLKKNVRSTDIVCRYGGEEMSVILSNTKKEEAIHTAQKLCNAVAERIFDLANNQKEHVTISLGVSTYPQNGETSQALIEYADKGLYKAKENGRNQVGMVDENTNV